VTLCFDYSVTRMRLFVILVVPGHVAGSRADYQEISQLTAESGDRNVCSNFFRERLKTDEAQLPVPAECPLDRTGFVFLSKQGAIDTLQTIYPLKGMSQQERQSSDLTTQLAAKATRLSDLLPQKTKDAARLLANFVPGVVHFETQKVCSSRPVLKRLLEDAQNKLDSGIPAIVRINFLLPFYQIVTRLTFCGKSFSEEDAVKPMPLLTFKNRGYVPVVAPAQNDRPASEKDRDVEAPQPRDEKEQRSSPSTPNLDLSKIENMIDPNEMLSNLHREIKTIVSIKNLWNRLTAIGADVTGVSVDIIHLSALLELEAEIASQELLLTGQFEDVETKIKLALETAKEGFIPPQSTRT
jgi:hypothetical protein